MMRKSPSGGSMSDLDRAERETPRSDSFGSGAGSGSAGSGGALMTADEAADYIRAISPRVIDAINEFIRITFVTRGGRMGSGMGLLLEGLWGYHMSQALVDQGIEIAWIADNQYNWADPVF